MRIRSLVIAALGVFLLLRCAAGAEGALYPVRENGKWGYMDRAGQTVIPPKWADAAPFLDGAAAVTDEEQNIRLIDTQGRLLGDEVYDVCGPQTPFCLLFGRYGPDGRALWGWYDRQSGHLEACRYTVLRDCETDCGLILAQWQDEGGAGRTAFLRRDTGEVAFFVEPDGELMSGGRFCEGYAYLAIETDVFNALLIDETGRKVTLPEGLYPASGVRDGVLAVTDASGGCGVARPDGTVVRLPENIYIDGFSEERAFFYPAGGAYDVAGILDTEGRTVAEPRWTLDGGWYGGSDPGFHNGYAVLLTLTDRNTAHDEYVILDRDGREVYRHRASPDDGTVLLLQSRVMPGGLLWYRLSSKDEAKYGLLLISGGRTEDLTGPVFDGVCGIKDGDPKYFYDSSLRFSEGLCPVCRDGRWGYIDALGETVISPAWDKAADFRDGLAQVYIGDRICYIDPAGTVVWEEK